jgi:small subunit ribosomal protein S16
MLKIKLSRTGKRDQARYRIVVSEAKSKRDGKFVDMIGYYNPETQPSLIEVDSEKYQNWIKKGAQPTKTVEHLFQKSQKSTK